ncbi:Uncharacterized protein PBTT_04959 [Plasmodiophora brassicae]
MNIHMQVSPPQLPWPSDADRPVYSRVKLDEWKSSSRTLQQKAHALEASIDSMLDRARPCFDGDAKSIADQKTSLDAQRLDQRRAMFARIETIKEKSGRIATFIRGVDRTDEKELSKLKAMIEDIDEHIVEFKLKRAGEFDAGAADQAKLEEAISASMSRLDHIDASLSETISARKAPAAPAKAPAPDATTGDPKRNAILSQVQAIQNLIDQDGGQYGDWEPADHQYWLRLWNTLDNVNEICERGAQEIPNQSFETVMDHCRWYERYTSYHTKKKELIAEWRQAKELAASKAVDEAVTTSRQMDEEAHRQTERSKQAAVEKERALIKWKEEKRQREIEERARQGAAQAKAEKDERRRHEKHLQELRDMLEKQRERNREKDDAANKQMTPAPRPMIDTRRLEARNAAMMMRRKKLVAAKRQADERRANNLAMALERLGTVVEAHADPKRLLSETKAAATRRLLNEAQAGEPKSTTSRPVAQPPVVLTGKSKAVPQWRKGI